MGTNTELSKLLEAAAKKCKAQIPHMDLAADQELLDKAAGKIMRVVFHLEKGLAVPKISIFGPGTSIVQENLVDAGYETTFSDYLVYQDVAFFGDVYPLEGQLLYAILSRVQLLDEPQEEFVSQAIFSENFDPKRLRI